MNITELIKLDFESMEVLGWNGGGSISIGYNIITEGDVFLYLPIHSKGFKCSDLMQDMVDMKNALQKLWGDRIESLEFFEDSKANSGYSVQMCLSINTSEKRTPE